jgi:spermidine/putrescine ABC transporter ATP-binding subunit
MIAGFTQPTTGEIVIDGIESSRLAPYQRNTGMVFQGYALFPHKTVGQNVAFGLRMRTKLSKSEIGDRVKQALKLVELEGFEERYPRHLSGGQQQRVALARVIVLQPAVLLLDEPLGALDLKLRKAMRYELKHLQHRIGITTIYVTHDQEEALAMSDRIVVMDQGKIQQMGTPEEIYHRPSNPFVADFIGDSNLLDGMVKAVDDRGVVMIHSPVARGDIVISLPSYEKNRILPKGSKVAVVIRPEHVYLLDNPADQTNCIEGKITEMSFLGSVTRLHVELSSHQQFIADIRENPGGQRLSLGQQVALRWAQEHATVIKREE